MGTAEARQKASAAVEARLTGPLRTLTAEWLAKGVVKVGVEAAGPPPSGLPSGHGIQVQTMREGRQNTGSGWRGILISVRKTATEAATCVPTTP